MLNKKIALAINYDYHDYGGMLQAFATQRVLLKIGVASEAINFDSLKNDIKKRKWKYFLSNVFDVSIVKEKAKVIEKSLKQKLNKSLRQKLTLRDAAFDRFCQSNFDVSRRFTDWSDLSVACNEYDAVLVGSDQLWLPSNVMADYYTLNFAPDRVNKIAYATSFGIGEIPAKYENVYARFLSRINHLSAREISGKSIIKKLVGRDVPLVCDPAMLLDLNGWNEVVSERIVHEKYIFCYFMGDNPDQRDFVKRLAQKTGCKVVALLHLDQYIPADESYVDYAPYDISPADFVSLIKHADYVCTDSFHGTVFSINYSKSFFTFKRFNTKASLSTNTRIISLLKTVDLMNRLYEGNESVDIDIDINNWDCIQQKVTEFRKNSLHYLKNALGILE